MQDDPAAIPGPLQLGLKAPPTHAARVFHPRSVSSPNPTPYSPDPGSPALNLPGPRRSSFSSSPASSPFLGGGAGGGKNGGHARSKSSTLPSIRSLKSRFQALSFGSTFGRKGPKVVKGDEAKRLATNGARVGGPVAGAPGLKGFSGPAGAADTVGNMSRSASLPSKLHAPRQERTPPSLPQLVFSADHVDEFGAKQSVDQALAHEMRSPVSMYSPSATTPARSPEYRNSASPPPRISPFPGRPIVIAPKRAASPLTSPFLRNTTSPGPPPDQRNSAASTLPSPYLQPSSRASHLPPTASPSAVLSAPIPQRVLSPIPPPSRRILNRVSQDFTRQPDAPPLSSLRKQQAAQRASLTRTLSRQGHRNSRILPGATLPSELADMALVRSKSAGADGDDDLEPRTRHFSAQLAPPVPLGSSGRAAARASWQVNGVGSEAARRIPGLLQRRHSVSPVVTPVIPQQPDDGEDEVGISPSGESASSPLEARAKEEHRGRSLSALLGRASTGLGFASPPIGGADGEQRPSKPFPPEFDEVPVQRVVVQQPSVESVPFAPYAAHDSPNKASLPLALGNVPHDGADYPDTPPSSARRSSSIPFVPPLEARESAASSSYSGSSDAAPPPPIPFPSTDERPPSLYNPFLPSTQELRKARSSSSLSSGPHPPRVSSVPPVPPLQREGDPAREQRDDDRFRRAELRAQRAKSENYAVQMSAVLAAEERGEKVDIDAVVAETTRARGEDERGRRTSQGLRTPGGRSFAQVIEHRNQGKGLDSPLQELIDELRARQPEEEAHAEEQEEEDDDDVLSEEHDGFEDSPVAGRHPAQDRSLRNVSFNSSPGGEYPFPLAGCLDASPATSPSVGRAGLRPISRPSYPPPSLSLLADAAPPLARSRSSPANPYAAAQHGSPTPLPSFSLHSPASLAGWHGAGESPLTLDQMEREIVRMEAELALAGRPQSLYEPEVSVGEDASTPVKAHAAGDDDQRAPSPSPAPISPAAVPPADLVTPRTARKWSILEIEKAYERMRRLLGASRGPAAGYAASEAGSNADDSLANVDVETALDNALEQARGFTGRQGDESDEDAVEVLEGVEDDETLKIPPPVDFSFDPSSPHRPSDDSFDSAHFDEKPLPGIPPPTPSPASERPAHEVQPQPPMPMQTREAPEPVAETPGVEPPAREGELEEPAQGLHVEEIEVLPVDEVEEPSARGEEEEQDKPEDEPAQQAVPSSPSPPASPSPAPSSASAPVESASELAVLPSDGLALLKTEEPPLQEAAEEPARGVDGNADERGDAGEPDEPSSPEPPAPARVANGDDDEPLASRSPHEPGSPNVAAPTQPQESPAPEDVGTPMDESNDAAAPEDPPTAADTAADTAALSSPVLDNVGPSRKYSSVDEALAGSLDDGLGAPQDDAAEQQPLASSSGRKRKDSDTGSAGGMRRLVLPSANRLRAKGTRDSMLSLVSIDDMLGEGDGDEQFAIAEPDRNGFTTPPTSPMRRNLQWARSSPSRLSTGGPLRSGVGRELQRRAGADDGEGEAQDGERSLLEASTRSRRISIHRLLEPTSPRDSMRRRSIVRTGDSDASSWYPQTPNRGSERVFRAEEPFDVLGKEDEQEREEMSATPDRSASIANIRSMDKLEIFFRYTAAKADMEKAELERDALIDALRETRTTLSDIRRQRDSLDVELKRERQFAKQVKEHLGGDPERHADRLDALVEGRQTWERRAQEALDVLARTQDELELLRAAVHDGREREELLERENVMLSARLAAAEMALDERAKAAQLAPTPERGASPFAGSPRSPPLVHANGFATSFASTAAPSSYATAPGGSPTLTMSRSASGATARPGEHHQSRFDDDDGDECEALAALPAFSIGRGPKDSLGSTPSTSSSAFDPSSGGFLSFGDVGSPILAQTLRFDHSAADDTATAKSSYGSSVAPPSPTRASGLAGWEPPAPLEFVPSQSGFTTFRVPFAPPHQQRQGSASLAPSSRVSSPALSIHAPLHPPARAASKLSQASGAALRAPGLAEEPEDGDDEGEFAGDASFDSASSYEPPPSANLRERDEAFLRDLTEEIEEPPVAPAPMRREEDEAGRAEERRGRRVSIR
ncbi:hypothetical protein JCM10449v2_003370 [Rhodotorula kratochvilovae]